MNRLPLLIAIAGPTASGKSPLAAALARQFHGEILNCDSLQMYRHFDIGTAKPTSEEREGIPHHLFDILDPDEQFAAGEYMRRARALATQIAAAGKVPIVAGGTGFYLRALFDGLFAGPSRDAALRARLRRRAEQKGPEYLHRLLKRLDPDSAASIHPNDIPKIARAVEVCLLSGRPRSELFQEGRAALQGFDVLKLGLNPPREQLYERINERALRMFENGLLDEVREILARGFAKDIPAFQSHGYRQALDYLDGKLSWEEAIYHAQTGTRQYAKRQMTWFRKEPNMHWLAGFGWDTEIQRQAAQSVSTRLSASYEHRAASPCS